MKPYEGSTYKEVVAALVALVYEDCSDNLSPDTAARMGLYASLPAEIVAVRVLKRLGKVKNVREAGIGIRADWVKEGASNEG